MFHLIHAKSLLCQRATFKEVVNDWGPIKFERPHEKVLEKWKEKNIKKRSRTRGRPNFEAFGRFDRQGGHLELERVLVTFS